MLTLLSILLLIAAAISFGWKQIKKSFDAQDAENEKFNETLSESSPRTRPIKNFPEFPLKVKSWMLVSSAILIFMFNGLFFWADAGTAYSVQYPWGGDKMIATQGLKIKYWGRTIPLSYETSIKDIIILKDKDGNPINELPENGSGIYNRVAQTWEFSDAIKADLAVSVITGVSIDDEDKFLQMADRNRSESKLISGRILPNIDAALKNTCKLMDAQEYISGKASDFDRYFKDQLENGMYLVEEYYEEEDNTIEIIGDTTNVRTVGDTKSSKQKRYRIKYDEQGNILRDTTSNTLKQYGLKIYQAKITSINWEQSFDKRLDLQKDQVAQTQLEKQEAEKEFYRAKKEIAKGEAEKASERARLEKEQIKLTIAAETEAKVAEQNEIVERRRLEVEKYKAQSVKVAADATYYKNQKLVQAGLTPQERADMDIQMNRDTWDGISKVKLDGVYILGDQKSQNGDGLLPALLGAEVAKNMKKKTVTN